MRFHSLNSMCLAAVFVAGCGPGGLIGPEGFGETGETEGPPTGDGDGDPTGDGDGDPTGDGDGDPSGDCVDLELGNELSVYLETVLEGKLGSDHDGECGASPGVDLSAAWTAPITASYRLSVFSDVPEFVSVLRGDCNGPVEACSAFNIPNMLEFNAVAGQRYTFVFDTAFNVNVVNFGFLLEPLPDVVNDCPVGELFGPQDSVNGATWGSSNDFVSPCGGETAPDHGYMFVPPVTGLYHIDMFGSDYDTVLHVFEGECGGPLVDCNDDAPNGMTLESELTVELFAGQLYTIVADGFAESAGNYQLNLELVDGPAGLCDGADLLPSTVPVFSEWPVELDFGNQYFGCSAGSFERRFVWTAPFTGLFHATQDASLNITGLAVLLDGCAGQDGLCAIPNATPWLVFPAEAGQEIVIVSEWELFEPGPINLSIDVESGAPGCGEALGAGVPVFASGNTIATGDDFDGSCSQSSPEAEYWWSAPATGTYLISLEGSNYDTLMFVRDGGCDGPELACNDDTITDQMVDLWSSIELDLDAGQTISIFVEGYNGSGSYDLAITAL